MTCFTCNALVPDGSASCPRCGAKLIAPVNPGNQGAQGAQGAQGYPVTQSNQEPQPYQGNQSYQGTQGYQDNQGYQGTQSYQGNQGYQSNQSYQGYQGNQSYQGNQGYQANQGYQGSQSYQGYQSAPAYQSTPGYQGNPYGAAAWNRPGDQPRNYAQEQKSFILDATGSIKKTFLIRLCQMLIYAAIAGIAIMSTMVTVWDVAKHPFVYNTLPMILKGGYVILFVLLLIRFSDLSGYEERFAKVLRYGALYMLFEGAGIFFNNSSSDYSSVITLLIGIGALLTYIFFMYHYCGAFADLTGTIDDTVAARWRMLLVINAVQLIAQLGGLLLIFLKLKYSKTFSGMYWALKALSWYVLIVPIVATLVLIIELVIFSKTVKSFESEQRYQ